MVSVAAGLAASGLRPWVYSIAPFVYARPFEQIRNDVCLHRLPVVLVGNGGGYGYGVMGATHHALEDYGALLCLPHLRAYVPAFDQDVRALVESLFDDRRTRPICGWGSPRSRAERRFPPYAAWRQAAGRAGLARPGDRAARRRHLGRRRGSSTGRRGRRSGCSASCRARRFPRSSWPTCCRSRRLLVVEEHVAQGGVAQNARAGSGVGRHRPGAVRRADGPGLSLGAVRLAEISIAASAGSTPRRSSSSSHARAAEMPHEVATPRAALAEKIRRLQGPILVLGASGFVGANLMRSLFAVRGDVFGTTTRKPAWRLEGLPEDHVRMVDLLIDSNLDALLRAGPAAHDLRLRRLRRLLVRDRQPAHLPHQLPVRHPAAAAAGIAVDRLLRPRRQLLGVRRQRRRARASATRPPPTATTPSPRSPRPT